MSTIPEVAKLLQQLVRIPSVNPAGDPGTSQVGEERMALFLKEHLDALGAETEIQPVAPGRPNVIARFGPPAVSKRAVILESHTDTVSVLGMTVPPFDGEIRDGRVWGRGACDTKGPMASVLMALRRLSEAAGPPRTIDVYFVGAMGEEAGNEGAIHLMQSGYFEKRGVKVEFAVALEPTGLRIVHKHKGAVWLKIAVEGRAAHGSRPELGDNAILKMRRAIDWIETELPAAFEKYADPELGRPTFSVNVIRGGSKTNIIADHCEIEVDHRALPGETTAGILGFFRERLKGFTVEVISSRPGLFTPPDDPHIRRLSGAIGRCGGPSRVLDCAPWFADSGVFGEAGVPSVAFGPGSIEQAHTRDEFIEIEQLVAGEKTLTAYLESLDES